MLKYYCAKAFDDVIFDLWVEVFASAESPPFNALNAVWDVNAGQRFALVKRRFSNACHTVRYVDAGQRFALVKRRVSNTRYSVRNII